MVLLAKTKDFLLKKNKDRINLPKLQQSQKLKLCLDQLKNQSMKML